MKDTVKTAKPDHTGQPDATLILAGALLGFLAIALGAFGAHAIEKSLSAQAIAWWKTAAAYHLPLSAATVTMGTLCGRNFPGAKTAGWCFVAGTIVFSGSLYLLALTGQKWLGAITPIGGVSILAGWLALAFGALKARTTAK